MTRDELKAAFLEQCPVMCDGIIYQRVSALIYRKIPGVSKFIVQGELLDRSGHSVTIAGPRQIERVDAQTSEKGDKQA